MQETFSIFYGPILINEIRKNFKFSKFQALTDVRRPLWPTVAERQVDVFQKSTILPFDTEIRTGLRHCRQIRSARWKIANDSKEHKDKSWTCWMASFLHLPQGTFARSEIADSNVPKGWSRSREKERGLRAIKLSNGTLIATMRQARYCLIHA